MQRLVGALLVVLAVAFSAGGVAVSVRADSGQSAAAPAPARGDQCELPNHVPIQVNAQAAELAAKDDTVPLNTQGYNYNAYENQWRPEVPAAAPPVPAAPAKP